MGAQNLHVKCLLLGTFIQNPNALKNFIEIS